MWEGSVWRVARVFALVAVAAACGDGGEQTPSPAAREFGREPTPSPAPPEPGEQRGGPATAQWELVEVLREAAAVEPHAADGGGRAWLERGADEAPVPVSSRQSFRLHFEVGPLGIAPGGAFYLQVSPFWGWSTPQTRDPDGPGYTEIQASDPALAWRAEAIDQQLLIVENTGEAWPPGARFALHYGAGPAGAQTDRHAERASRFWFAVDGDGDGHRSFLVDSPGVDVSAGPPTRLRVTAPSLVRPGERFRVSLAWLDAVGNAGTDFSGELEWVDPPEGLELPDALRFGPEAGGVLVVEGVAREAGLYHLAVRSGETVAHANPLQVDADAPRVLWADLHGHSALSDGTGQPSDYFRFARDVSALDVVALTDHDHWGLLPLAAHPELWEQIRAATLRFHQPGRFVTLLGFEWTSWIHGHRHVLWFGDEGTVIDSLAEETDSPEELWAALDAQGHDALTFAHHPAGGPIAVNWDVPPDPRYEPVTEIVSVHGSSEAADSPGLIYDPVPGHFARDALDRGYRLGFVGSSDSHDGHPGTYNHRPVLGGLAAILSEDRTREGVLEALRQRRAYATNGPRILLRTALGATPMGGVLTLEPGAPTRASLFVRAVGTAALDRIDLIRTGRVVDSLALNGQREVSLQRDIEELAPGEYLYVRVVQEDGGAAWSSPIFID